MPRAARLDPYHGTITTPLDFSQAQPLQCNYPDAGPVEPGDFFSIPDTTPNPAPGQATYFITAVTYQGETRMGRKAQDGQLSGKDASVLPGVCSDA